MENTTERKRISAIDALRGVAIIYMVLFHFFYDLDMLGVPFGSAVYNSQLTVVLFDSGLFVLLSGICCNFSRSNLLRGARLLPIAYVLTAVTAVLFPTEAITFGVLHMLSISMLLYGAFEKIWKKLPAVPCLAVCVLLIILTFHTKDGYFGLGALRLDVPEFLTHESRLYMFGFLSDNYAAVDYFPLLPYVFLFFAGAFLGRLVDANRERLPESAFSGKPAWLCALGRRSLLIYLVHQPVCLAVAYLVKLLSC